MNEPFAFYQQSADYVRARMPFEPQIAVILGSSLGPFAGQLQDPVAIDYHEMPNFLTSTAPGHAGKLIFGTLAGKRLVCLSGRFHSYEGYDFEQLTQPVRLLKLLGVRALIVTNAAGGVNERYRPGDFMLIADHIKLNGASPLRGRNVDEFGPRFFDVTRMYTPELRTLAKRCAEKGEHMRARATIALIQEIEQEKRRRAAASGLRNTSSALPMDSTNFLPTFGSKPKILLRAQRAALSSNDISIRTDIYGKSVPRWT